MNLTLCWEVQILHPFGKIHESYSSEHQPGLGDSDCRSETIHTKRGGKQDGEFV
ncbi:unnamed protein product [Sphenostylis stenocarpa]|uniref:Uncharacterized protein n=1 Tax=Sphenostylis stenocarpa TaxID=92480 RepID=A0AA86SJD6_9FABA|nr:unnamed protein product [Sphenostylis stenocarpa]